MDLDKVKYVNNPKGDYISFSNPYILGERGGKKQINKHVKKALALDSKRVESIMHQLHQILNAPDKYSGYEGFLKAKTEEFDEFTINAIYNGLHFMDTYHSEHIIDIMEKKIKLLNDNKLYNYPNITFIGYTGSGKSTTIKPIIGSTTTSFPAAFQSNSTVGSMQTLCDDNAKNLQAFAMLTNNDVLKDISKGLSEKALTNLLESGGAEENTSIDIIAENKKMVYASIGESVDRRKKLSTLFGDYEKLIDTDKIKIDAYISNIMTSIKELWHNFKAEFPTISIDNISHITILPKYKDNLTSENKKLFISEVGEYISKSNELDRLSDELHSLILERINRIIPNLITELKNGLKDGYKFSFEYVADGLKNIITNENSDDIKLFNTSPEYIYITVWHENNTKPNKNLRNWFFNCLEFLSSSKKSKRSNTIMLILESLRLYGNFRPVWIDDNELLGKYLLTDTEGVGHEERVKELPISLLKQIRKSDLIIWVVNGTVPFQKGSSAIFSTLASEGLLSRTKYAVNRLDHLDTETYEDDSDIIAYVKEGFNAMLEFIKIEEQNSGIGIITGMKGIYVKDFDNQYKPLKGLEKVGDGSNFNGENKKLFSHMFELIKETEQHINETYSFQSIYDDAIFKTPNYSDRNFTFTVMNIGNAFKKDFLSKINSCHWQTLKAFCLRVAYNYDDREWGILRLESLINITMKQYMATYFLNPQNKDSSIKNSEKFLSTIEFVLRQSEYENNGKLGCDIEKLFISDINDLWLETTNLSGTGSSHTRKYIITKIVEAAIQNEVFYEIVEKYFYNNYYANKIKGIK